MIFLCDTINHLRVLLFFFLFFFLPQNNHHGDTKVRTWLKLFKLLVRVPVPQNVVFSVLEIFAVYVFVFLGPELPPYYGPILGWPI